MKTAEPKTASSPHLHQSGEPFFQKNGESTFFSNSQTDFQTKPFFNKQAAQPFIQTKLTIGQPGDKYEQEADAMADRVVQRLSNPEAIQTKPAASLANTVTPVLQPKCAACEEEEQIQKKEEDEDRLENGVQLKPMIESDEPPPTEDIQRKCAECEKEDRLQKKGESDSSKNASTPSLESRLSSSKGSGSPLPDTTRGQMESSFGADFSNVRIHTGSSAVQMNQDLNAQAFTHGSDIYFNGWKFNDASSKGKHLLAHELTHVMQQQGGVSPKIQKFDPPFSTESQQPKEYIVKGPYKAGDIELSGGEKVIQLPGALPPMMRVKLPIPYQNAGEPFHIPISMLRSTTEKKVEMQVRVLSDDEFEQMTGIPSYALPENQLVSADILQDVSEQSLLGPAVGPAMLGARMPSYPISPNATGFLWGHGHLSFFSNVEGQLTQAGGFRSSLWRHAFADMVGGRTGESLNTGAPGRFQNDKIFTIMPQGRQTAVYIESTAGRADAFGNRIVQNIGAAENKGTYRYPPPEPGTALFEQLYGKGAKSDTILICGANNCITQPRHLYEPAIGVSPEVVRSDSSRLNLVTGLQQPEGTSDPFQQGRGARMREFVNPENPFHQEHGIKVQEIPAMTRGGRLGVTFVKGAGGILMIYGVYETSTRIFEAYDTPQFGRVVTQETGAWVGGALGSALGAAGVGAVVCSPTGPVTFVCAAGGFAGGLVVGAIGAAGGSYVADKIYDAVTDRQGNFNPIGSGIEYAVEKGLESDDPQVRSDAILTKRAFLEGDSWSVVRWFERFAGLY